MGLKVLITNGHLRQRAGTEMVVHDLALALRRKGHTPAVYTFSRGELGLALAAQGIPVLTSLPSGCFEPDIIHGHHFAPTLRALARFPDTPAIHICHDHWARIDRTPLHPRILARFGVSAVCRDRVDRESLATEPARWLGNWVDTDRFQPRPELPERPRRALVFSNYASGGGSLQAIEEACRRAGIQLEVVGSGVARASSRPETVLGDYDLVFAKAKAALEAMAVGAAVILCDYAGAGPLVSSANIDRLFPLNFGFQALDQPHDPRWLLAQIERYDRVDAVRVRDRVRAEASLDSAVAGLLTVYDSVLAEFRTRPRLPEPRLGLRPPLWLSDWCYLHLLARFDTPRGRWIRASALGRCLRPLVKRL